MIWFNLLFALVNIGVACTLIVFGVRLIDRLVSAFAMLVAGMAISNVVLFPIIIRMRRLIDTQLVDETRKNVVRSGQQRKHGIDVDQQHQ